MADRLPLTSRWAGRCRDRRLPSRMTSRSGTPARPPERVPSRRLHGADWISPPASLTGAAASIRRGRGHRPGARARTAEVDIAAHARYFDEPRSSSSGSGHAMHSTSSRRRMRLESEIAGSTLDRERLTFAEELGDRPAPLATCYRGTNRDPAYDLSHRGECHATSRKDRPRHRRSPRLRARHRRDLRARGRAGCGARPPARAGESRGGEGRPWRDRARMRRRQMGGCRARRE